MLHTHIHTCLLCEHTYITTVGGKEVWIWKRSRRGYIWNVWRGEMMSLFQFSKKIIFNFFKKENQKKISRNKMQLVSEQYHLLRPRMSTQLVHEGPDRGTMWVIIDQNGWLGIMACFRYALPYDLKYTIIVGRCENLWQKCIYHMTQQYHSLIYAHSIFKARNEVKIDFIIFYKAI